MKELNRKSADVSAAYPERVIQFGGGNFLRAFADWMIDVYNKKKQSELGILAVTSSVREKYQQWQAQDGLYHVLTKGYQQDQTVDRSELISSVSRVLQIEPDWEAFLLAAENQDIRFVLSNTTEAGIRFTKDDQRDDAPPREFPAQLTAWLYRRFETLGESTAPGMIFLPTELILDNGDTLRTCIIQYAEHWELENGFIQWINSSAHTFCNTLVDRIVPGVGSAQKEAAWTQVGYQDAVITQGEAFHFWAIEAPAHVQEELPLNEVGLDVFFTDDLTPYRTRKVRILNGAHTAMVPVGVLYGTTTVKEAVEHEVMGEFIRRALSDEIIPTLDLPKKELEQFAQDVIDRFRNPFIRHELMSISLNSITKFKTRVLPSILAYQRKEGSAPPLLLLSLAALIHFYKGQRFNSDIKLNDDPKAIAFLQDLWQAQSSKQQDFAAMTTAILGWEYAWGQDLNKIAGLPEMLQAYLTLIEEAGMTVTLNKLIH